MPVQPTANVNDRVQSRDPDLSLGRRRLDAQSRMQFHLGTPLILLAAVSVVLLASGRSHAQWPQWGGPNRDFTVETSGLGDKWPDDGPPRLWHRTLGDGYSAIVYDEGVLYTMYRKGAVPFEYTIALDSKNGKKVWESKHRSPIPESGKNHPGPHSTPLVSGDRLFAVGRNAVLRCYDKKDGTVLWEHDLAEEYGAVFSDWGYSPSPIACEGMVVVPVGRRRPNFQHQPPSQSNPDKDDMDANAAGRTLMAFDEADGRLVWKSQDFGIDHSSPILAYVEGKRQLVFVTPAAAFAVDPPTGELLWLNVFDQVYGYMVTPLWTTSNLLFLSSPGGGSHTYRIVERGGESVVEQAWHSNNLRMAFTNPVQAGEYLIGISGTNPGMLTCVNMETGQRAWVDRTFGVATLLYADRKLIILDQDGNLALATVTAEGLTVHSQCKVTERESFTVPTLVGTTLYVRDRKNIMALDLG